MGKYFRTVPRMTAFDKISHTILGCLNSSLEGNGGITIKASKRGISISFRGKPLAKGKTPDELQRNFDAALSIAKQSTPAAP